MYGCTPDGVDTQGIGMRGIQSGNDPSEVEAAAVAGDTARVLELLEPLLRKHVAAQPGLPEHDVRAACEDAIERSMATYERRRAPFLSLVTTACTNALLDVRRSTFTVAERQPVLPQKSARQAAARS